MPELARPCLSDGEECIIRGWSADGCVILDPTACISIPAGMRCIAIWPSWDGSEGSKRRRGVRGGQEGSSTFVFLSSPLDLNLHTKAHCSLPVCQRCCPAQATPLGARSTQPAPPPSHLGTRRRRRVIFVPLLHIAQAQ